MSILYNILRNFLVYFAPIVILIFSISLNLPNASLHKQTFKNTDFYNKLSREIKNLKSQEKKETGADATTQNSAFYLFGSSISELATPSWLEQVVSKNLDLTSDWLLEKQSEWSFYFPSGEVQSSLSQNLDKQTKDLVDAKKPDIIECSVEDLQKLKSGNFDLAKNFCLPKEVKDGTNNLSDFLPKVDINSLTSGLDLSANIENFKAQNLGIASSQTYQFFVGARQYLTKIRVGSPYVLGGFAIVLLILTILTGVIGRSIRKDLISNLWKISLSTLSLSAVFILIFGGLFVLNSWATAWILPGSKVSGFSDLLTYQWLWFLFDLVSLAVWIGLGMIAFNLVLIVLPKGNVDKLNERLNKKPKKPDLQSSNEPYFDQNSPNYDSSSSSNHDNSDSQNRQNRKTPKTNFANNGNSGNMGNSGNNFEDDFENNFENETPNFQSNSRQKTNFNENSRYSANSQNSDFQDSQDSDSNNQENPYSSADNFANNSANNYTNNQDINFSKFDNSRFGQANSQSQAPNQTQNPNSQNFSNFDQQFQDEIRQKPAPKPISPQLSDVIRQDREGTFYEAPTSIPRTRQIPPQNIRPKNVQNPAISSFSQDDNTNSTSNSISQFDSKNDSTSGSNSIPNYGQNSSYRDENFHEKKPILPQVYDQRTNSDDSSSDDLNSSSLDNFDEKNSDKIFEPSSSQANPYESSYQTSKSSNSQSEVLQNQKPKNSSEEAINSQNYQEKYRQNLATSDKSTNSKNQNPVSQDSKPVQNIDQNPYSNSPKSTNQKDMKNNFVLVDKETEENDEENLKNDY